MGQEQRITEWQVPWLEGTKRGPKSIAEFLAAWGESAGQSIVGFRSSSESSIRPRMVTPICGFRCLNQRISGVNHALATRLLQILCSWAFHQTRKLICKRESSNCAVRLG